MSQTHYGPVSWERMIRAVEKVRERLERAVAALEAAAIPYAVAGGNAVAAWVSRVDEAAVRNTQDVDILLRRNDLEQVKTALAAAGFVFRHVKSIDMFLDGPNAKARDAVHVIYATEKVSADSLAPSPDVTEIDDEGPFNIVDIEPLVQMKLTSYRLKDRVHLLDMIGVGLIDATWPTRFSPELAERLQNLLDNPES
ncbi:MAG: nucleotidyltransferase family protein [Pirellulales bacterium]